VLGHRGVRGPKPENTLAAFERARLEGADGVELDVRLCRGGDVVVIHDRTLTRVTQGRDARDCETLTASELARCDVGEGEGVPLLSDVLAWATRHDLRVNVELKHDVSSRPALVEAVAELFAGRPSAGERILFSSFDPVIVRALAWCVPSIVSAWLVHDEQRFARHAFGFRLLGADAVHPQSSLVTERRVQRWKAAGALVNVWTVNDPEDARRLDRLGVDAIISDRPEAILAALRTS
jgi:glycerophosphoryl diester phosphodiesterase